MEIEYSQKKMLFDAHFFGNLPLIFIFNHLMHSIPMYFNANKQGISDVLRLIVLVEASGPCSHYSLLF